MTPEEFRRRGHELVDWIADYRAGIVERPVMASVTPGQIAAQLPASPPQTGESVGDILRDLESIILPGLSHWTHPQFFGFFPSNSDLSSVLGDWASTGLGVLGLNWAASPALTELEDVTTDWLRQMVALTPAWRGVIADTASTSTLVALISALERATDFARDRGGLQAEPRPLVVYTSDESHSSVEKAALLAGVGREHLRLIPHDEDGAMRADALADAIDADRRAGRTPCAVVATTGTTARTAHDPLNAIADVTEPHHLWLHVDAAMAGSAMILPECRPLWSGIERADSVVINPHKWLGAAFDCSVYYVRDADHLVRVMATSPSYLRDPSDALVRNLRNWGLPLGRRFRALKLWFLIREAGVQSLQARLRRDIENARWLAGEVSRTSDWRVLNRVSLQTVCVRHEPAPLAGEALDRHTREWVDRVNRSGDAYLTAAQVDGQWLARVSIGAIQTEREHVSRAFAVMRREAERDWT